MSNSESDNDEINNDEADEVLDDIDKTLVI